VHNLQTLYLVNHAGLPWLTWPGAAAWCLVGVTMIWLNYDADTQRLRVRAADGHCMVWGRPAEVIRATYTTNDGRTHSALLVCSGYAGLVRHFHYVPDMVLLALYCVPAGFQRVLPYTYLLYLSALLIDRTYRIDARCAAKYGPAWDAYVRRVPYKLVPGLF
jgi:7-dehydrocholesterol reductase